MKKLAHTSISTLYLMCSIVLVALMLICSVGVQKDITAMQNSAKPVDHFSFSGSEPENSEVVEQFRSGPDGADLGGISRVHPGVTIYWESESIKDSHGVSPLNVMIATRNRLSHLQKSPHASDDRAKALWKLDEAINLLQGKPDITSSVLGDDQ